MCCLCFHPEDIDCNNEDFCSYCIAQQEFLQEVAHFCNDLWIRPEKASVFLSWNLQLLKGTRSKGHGGPQTYLGTVYF